MTAVPATIESIDATRIAQRRYAVLALYGLSAVWGVTQLVVPDNSLLDTVNALAFATSATFWFTIERRMLSKTRLPILHLLFFFTWPVASLIHLLASRGIRGIGYWLLHAVGLFATMCLTFLPAMLVLYWMGVLDLEAVTQP